MSEETRYWITRDNKLDWEECDLWVGTKPPKLYRESWGTAILGCSWLATISMLLLRGTSWATDFKAGDIVEIAELRFQIEPKVVKEGGNAPLQ